MAVGSDAASQSRRLEAEDVLLRPQITEVQIAPDGSGVSYVVRTRDLESDQQLRAIWLWTESEGATRLPITGAASQLRWRPGTETLSYLAPDSAGVVQVWEYTRGSGVHPFTNHARSVSSYEWSPDGQCLAFTAPASVDSIETMSMAGVVIDNVRFFHARLLAHEPLEQRDSHYGDPQERAELWIQTAETGSSTLVSDSLSVSGYAWSPDGGMLATTAHATLGRLPKNLARHDLILYNLSAGELELLEAGSGGDHLDDTVIYGQPFWSPDGTRIGYFRIDRQDRWAASPQLGVFSLVEDRTVILIPDEVFETYEPRAFWLNGDTVLLENTHRAGRRLFAVSLNDASVVPLVDTEDWLDQHSFSRDGRIVAFVRERIDLPGDLYLSDRAMREPRRLTDLHAGLDATKRPRVERLSWAGEDGTVVDGWLYLPPGEPPYPTIVFVHGGPTWVFRNRYEPYVIAWPHAMSAYAARGMAVFVPNYRGTGSYGKAFRRRSALDAEPVTDIMAGVNMLVERGVADGNRLGIAGHSHGCWLAPLIAVRHRRFAAGACAEGVANWASAYARNAGWMNAEILEHYWGGGVSPYENPERYRELSPVFGFEGLRTPFLFEAGELSGALNALEYATAAWRVGMPHELIIYRDTDHNVTKPTVMLEVMERNLEWFEFWLLGRREAPSFSKQSQYERWRRLRSESRWGTG